MDARATIAPRATDGRFIKGISGNPGGRKPVPYDVVKLAQSRTAVAIDTLTEVCLNKKANAGARVMAASVLLDRAWGKAIQRSETKSLNVNLSELTDGQLLAMLQELHPGATLPGLPAPTLEDTVSSSQGEESQAIPGVIAGEAKASHETSHETPKRRAKGKTRAKGLSSKEAKVLRASRRRVPSPLPPGASESRDPGGDGDGSPL